MSARPKQLLGRKKERDGGTNVSQTEGGGPGEAGRKEGIAMLGRPAGHREMSRRRHRRDRANSLLLLPPSRPISVLSVAGTAAREAAWLGALAALIRCARRPYVEVGNGAQIDEGGREEEGRREGGEARTAEVARLCILALLPCCRCRPS